MSTKVRSKLQKSNKYCISQHRYYELKHFCLQYPIWKKTLSALGGCKYGRSDISVTRPDGSVSDPTADFAEEKIFYSERISMIERTADQTDHELSDYILKGVTEGVSYEHLKAKLNIPCCREKYYELYRRFFYLLSIERQ